MGETLPGIFSSLTPEELSSIALQHSWRAEPATMLRHLLGASFQKPRHVQSISRRIRKAFLTPGSRTLITTPPQVGKTTTAVLGGALWAFDQLVDPKIVLCTYGQKYTNQWSFDLRELIRRHGPTLNWTIDPRRTAVDRWYTTEGGEFFGTSISGGLTGKNVDILLIDDPYKNWADAYSDANLEKVEKWWYSTAYTRLHPDAAVVLIMTRWNVRDLAGKLEEKMEAGGDKWEVINYPAIAIDANDPMGRKPGESLWPERFNVADYDRIKENVTELIWWPLYQGRPRSSLSKHFDRVRYYGTDDMPLARNMERMIGTWDTPDKDKLESDWCAGQVWGRAGDDVYLFDAVHEHAAFTRQCEMIRHQDRRWKRLEFIRIEDAASGPSLYDHLHREIPKLELKTPLYSKEVRAVAIHPFVERGNVWLPDPKVFPWAAGLVKELTEFPDSAHDDQVDAATMAISALLLEDETVTPSGVSKSLESEWRSRWKGRE